jgi:hypothetical protein
MHAFRGIPASLKDPRVDLLSLSVDQLRGLPPALVITVDAMSCRVKEASSSAACGKPGCRPRQSGTAE